MDFKSLSVKVPEYVYNYNFEKQVEIYNYLQNLNENQMQAYKIAYEHLGSSFNIYKSNGFMEWKIKNIK